MSLAPAEVTYAAASELDLRQQPLVRALFTSRSFLLGKKPDEVDRPRTLLAWMESLGWTVLADVPGRHVVVGNIIRPGSQHPYPSSYRRRSSPRSTSRGT
ncbi:MAG: hypothetical protein M1337_05055 [Actinobacteria bacterium]|nr:hypothetical protein [Actinomycetota bacterium]